MVTIAPVGTRTGQTLGQLLGHNDPDGTCSVCVRFRAELAAIAESERRAFVETRDVFIR